MKQPPRSALDSDLDRLDKLVDGAVALIGRLRSENRELSRRLAESERRRKVAATRLDSLLEKIEDVT
ncbi:MAG: hypothetical protein R6X12_05700 [bacterium]